MFYFLHIDNFFTFLLTTILEEKLTDILTRLDESVEGELDELTFPGGELAD